MDLSAEQKNTITEWIESGLGLADIQKGLQKEFEINMTYMDVRFLLLDMGLEVQDKPEDVAEEDVAEPTDPSSAAPGGVSVNVDRIMKPGALVSGAVTFSDGKSGLWSLDQAGRLALDMGDPTYKPTEPDIAEFQKELKSALESSGF